MKKIALFVLLLFVSVPMLAQACPKGTHPVGGTGSHHKGGRCV